MEKVCLGWVCRGKGVVMGNILSLGSVCRKEGVVVGRGDGCMCQGKGLCWRGCHEEGIVVGKICRKEGLVVGKGLSWGMVCHGEELSCGRFYVVLSWGGFVVGVSCLVLV